MKNAWIGIGMTFCLLLAACGTSDEPNQVKAGSDGGEEISTSPDEAKTEDSPSEDENEASLEEATDTQGEESDVTFSIEELEAVFYIGMNYTTYLDEVTGVFEIEHTYTDEDSNDMLDVFEAYDGYLAILYSPDEGIKQFIHYDNATEASSFFN